MVAARKPAAGAPVSTIVAVLGVVACNGYVGLVEKRENDFRKGEKRERREKGGKT